ncbi:3-hydroxyacyl-CoA dehydrogenase NAD-binding domain-containing protein [Trinickia caryophylli]|uniref:Short chain enoyl-CoA hydratase /3-hydroxyacyl-CoA dehydrogenase n=1 Tax=Trinickia caryophylli TaxID=28094 RepID=A0A1X7H4U5_TRICW|nr:3-hydroxyacyl-CoA dehydrogenase NAD-binding domain-containing protein [Trinickia caryophylli]PMS09578.1 3-hydroxyacyl-CoA dehydrogenase [Trinickia caryophylli]TRX17290.1 3-hydroxyacyl-CoA dehydrogenase [Trinickia caryophylli]WQE11969.1 3-hydroxyacyl-CoA dehydrogenase NAD-binding domain-containing protein [Trinickia caryophylli]SMF79570.1 short chain enoyl-CoA hydratase /3-hydroxyacyl-CoA dehydrogenase [Trinickia caryophylli]GLU35637.1 3-hydroxyacyl-CoA dehydrogenase [Trinickia caryophylli]
MPVEYTLRNGVAFIALDHPPVNALGAALRAGIAAALERALADPAAVAIVLTGKGEVFSGGADIAEFGTPAATASPDLPAVIAALEASAKPVVAALGGLAMGGGLELAMGARYRIAGRGARIALPEVKLGLLPGAGGTQRLPRGVGVARAIDLIVSGNAVKAQALAETALFDEIVDDAQLREAALRFAAQFAARAGGPQASGRGALLRDRPIDAEHVPQVLAAARERLAKAAPPLPAPAKCIDAIERGIVAGFEAGLAFERSCFEALSQTPESRALRHAFFSERAATKIADVPASTPVREIRRVGIVGAGTMGTGIAMCFADAGVPVTLVDIAEAPLQRSLADIRRNYDASVRKGRLDEATRDARFARIAPTLSYDALADADLVIEAVFEEMDVKTEVFARIDSIAKPGAILATNTSTLDVDRIAAVTKRPGDVLGMHFFSPANVMKLLEVVRGAQTAKDVLATVMRVARAIGKTAVVSGVCDGFIGNRMVEPYLKQALYLVEEGASPAQIDAAIEHFGFAMGPFRMSDLAGNDISWAIRKRRYREAPGLPYPRIADRVCEAGRFGQKTGAGWYDYRPGEREPHASPAIEAIIAAHREAIGSKPRAIGDEEIVGRLVYALVNEGARILADGIAAKASDIDAVYLNGYGFPAWRGGPMFYAQTVGLANVAAAIERYASQPNGEAFVIAPLLAETARDGGRFGA